MKTLLRRIPLLLAALALLATGCDDDDTTDLAGTWQASKLVFTPAGGARQSHPLPAAWQEQLSLNLDGSFSFSSTQAGRTATGRGRWAQTATELVLHQKRERRLASRLDGKTLIISGNLPEGAYALQWRKTAAP
jgi:uncharacterized lipoprotein NlpE involved in copper resistance